MTHEECKQWFAYHAAAFPAFERVYSGLRKASTDSARHGWNFIMRDLEDVSIDEARDATDYMRAVNSQMKPEQHSREVARIAMTQRLKRREQADTWQCQLCRDSGTALIFAGCCRFLLRRVEETYWKCRQDKEGNPIPPDPRWRYFVYGVPCCCAASPDGNEWLRRHQDSIVTGWKPASMLTEEERIKIETGAELLTVSNGWQRSDREEMEF